MSNELRAVSPKAHNKKKNYGQSPLSVDFKKMKLEITTPEKRIFEGDVDLVQLPGLDGLFEVLNNHAPMIAALGKGKVKIGNNNEYKFIEINGGVVEVLNNRILVLAE